MLENELIIYFIDNRSNPLVLGGVFICSLLGLYARYFVLDSFLYGILFTKQKLSSFHIQQKYPSHQQVREEIKWGLLANPVLAAVGVLVHWMIFSDHTLLYYNSWNEKGSAYYFLSILILLVSFDTWFYWTHYLMHKWKWLYRKVHLHHHKSKSPTPFSDLSLHPVEALMNVLFFPVVLTTVPIHHSVLGIFYLFLILGNVFGHLGHEFIPARIAGSWWGRHITFMAYHNFHHSHVHGNLGFFFKFWDKVMKTEVEPYNQWLIHKYRQETLSESSSEKPIPTREDEQVERKAG